MSKSRKRRAGGSAALAALFFFATVGIPLIHPLLHTESAAEAGAFRGRGASEAVCVAGPGVARTHGVDDCPVCVFLSGFHSDVPPAVLYSQLEDTSERVLDPVFLISLGASYCAATPRAPPA